MRMAANNPVVNRQHQLHANQYGLLPPALTTTTHLPSSAQQQHFLGAAAITTSPEVIFSIGVGGVGGGAGVIHAPIPLTVAGIAPISQSSSTSSSYGTTTSTTIALPLEAPLRYPSFITTSYSGIGIAGSSNNNFNHNFNNNFNTTSVGACQALSMSTGPQSMMGGGGGSFSGVGVGVGSMGNNFNNNFNGSNNNNADLASVDSSDTYASCQTHPFHSQGDLTADLGDEACALDIDMDNLYINPLEKETATTSYVVGLPVTTSTSSMSSRVKKSASGDTALRNLAAGGGLSPMDDVYQSFEVQERGSRVSLNENPVPKHRKTRFQQSFTTVKPRARFEDSRMLQETTGGVFDNSGSPAAGSGGSKKKRSSFMPGKSLVTATKLINQHLFGIQNAGTKAKFESKHSSSIDSIDASPNLEHHRRSKSILKNKSDISRVLTDPESERLLADNMSGSGVSDNGTVMGESGSDYSPNKLPHALLAKSISPPPLRHRTLIQQRSGPATLQSKTTKFQTPRYPEEQALRQVKPVLARSTAASHMSGDSGNLYDPTNRDSSLDSETTFTSNVNIRCDDAGGDSGAVSNGEAGGGSSDENRSLLPHRSSQDKESGGGSGGSGAGDGTA